MSPNQEKSELLRILTRKSVCHGSFTLASGAKSDLYVDAKLTTMDPAGAVLVGRVGWELIKETAAARGIQTDAVGGLTMGADAISLSIGIAAHLEDPATSLQTFTVRKSLKAHGRQKLIEGNFTAGNSVVVIDDVITTGGSTLQAIDAIEAEGGRVAFVIALVDRQEGGRENIQQRGHHVVPIFTRADLLAVADAGRQA
ncbi:MAG: orotate phosphoribosyltransferase [Chthoniobacter sp.]|jgi:orotate phosphoribosyltransferase|nr:orotate phosphoribosyltransferase [Chthoniobacter sp.]